MAAASIVLLATACGSDASMAVTAAVTTTVTAVTAAVTTEAPTPTAPPAPVQVQALDNSFRLQDLTVVVGTEVVWRNVGRNDHDVTPLVVDDAGEGAWGVPQGEFGPGAEHAHVFEHPGVYEYVCTIHGVNGKGMVGTVTVTG